jgi:cupin 2 domain-containing protein
MMRGMPAISNFFADIPASLPVELMQTVAKGRDVRIERIISRGHRSEEGFWYDQPEYEWVILLRGAARIRFADDDVVMLEPGDYLNIAAHEKHRVEWTDPNVETLWLAVHYS